MKKADKNKPVAAKAVKRKPRTKPPAKKVLKPGSKDGRPTIFNDEIASKILAFIRAGNYVETAAAGSGLSKVTLYAWLKKGAAEKTGKFWDFSNAVERAMAEADMLDLSDISKAARAGSWQAAAWRLERRNPKQFGRVAEDSERTVKVDIVDPDGKKTTFTMKDIYAGLTQINE